MAEHDIIQNMIFHLGQSQGERMPAALGIHHADVDERSAADLLRFARQLAPRIKYFSGDATTPAGDWSAFFPGDETAVRNILEHTSGEITPHLALFAAFLELYALPQELINRITGRHLDFFYREVLRFTKKEAVPDRVHLVLELKKNAAPIILGPDRQFSAGKDATGKERIYAPRVATVINRALVTALRSLYVDASGHGRVLAAPVANSADGLGQELNPLDPKWHGLGHPDLPAAAIGFALAAPVLRMREGTRTVTVALTLGPVKEEVTAVALKDAFEVFLTGEKQWLGPLHPDSLTLTNSVSGSSLLQFSCTLDAREQAVIDYDQEIHGGVYNSDAPVLQVLVRESCRSIGYNQLKHLTLEKAAISVQVSGLTALALENDSGALDAKKPFLPFGNQPVKGSRFLIGCPEALTKKLSELTLTVQWQDAPASFRARYAGYGDNRIDNDFFTAGVSFQDGGNWHLARTGEPLFETASGARERTFTFQASSSSATAAKSTEGQRLRALERVGSRWATRAVQVSRLQKPLVATRQKAAPEARQGCVILALERSFLHAEYRKKYVEQVVTYSKTGTGALTLLAEPYTPAIRTISIGYRAYSDTVRIGSAFDDPVTVDDFASPDLHFYHTTPFGQMREHGYQREQFAFLADHRVSLLPRFDHEGELLIGLEHLQGGDSVSVLFQVAEGSADPELPSQPVLWSVLCDNYWQPLGEDGVVRDTTNQLLTSGLLTFVLPRAATATNTILPGGRIWLQAAVTHNVAAVAQLLEVAANAVEARFVDNGNDPAHLAAPLAEGSITRLRNELPEIKSIRQPYASFGARSTESDAGFHVRVAERLRHKNRCITPWDYERIILEAFPAVHRVKCIPHATGDCWLAPGNVLIVVVPDLRNTNGSNILQPKVDADTLTRIAAHVGGLSGSQVKVQVCNPRYQQILLDFKVRFHTGYAFNTYSKELESAILRHLSPWVYGESGGGLGFGGTIYKSVLLDFVEELAYVDYVEEFRMYSFTASAVNSLDRNQVQPWTPDSILVSAERHRIGEVE